MRVVIGAAGIACLLGLILAVFRGDARAVALFAFGVWVSSGWFVALQAAHAKVDEILDEEDQS